MQRKILKRYVYPDFLRSKKKSRKNNYNIPEEEKVWKYYNPEEKLSEEEKIINIFKDNVFLAKIQKCYEALEILILSLDENQKNIECLQKNIEIGENKIILLSQLNSHLNNIFNNNELSSQIQTLKQNNNSIDNKNGNVQDRLNLVKSLNILDNLKILNSISDLNKQENKPSSISKTNTTSTTITNNNNIILDNKIINNNNIDNKNNDNLDNEIVEVPNFTYQSSYNNNDEFGKKINYDFNNNDSNFLNKKYKRDESNNNNINNNINNKSKNNFYKNNRYNFKFNKSKKYFNNNYNKNWQNSHYQKRDINKYFIKNNNNTNIIDNNIKLTDNNLNNYQEKDAAPINLETPADKKDIKIEISPEKETEKDDEKTENTQNEPEENKSKNNNDNTPNNTNTGNNKSSVFEFEKILKIKFPSIFTTTMLSDYKKNYYNEIKNIIDKIPNLKFNQENKFDDPYLVGSYSHINLIYLLDYLPGIDILFKCKDIKSLDELKIIAKETIQNKLSLDYIEIDNDYDKHNEIVKLTNKCKIKIKNNENNQDNNNIFIYINLFFIGINLSSFNQKEESINKFFFNNKKYISVKKEKILICLYFRRWRRTFRLFFIMPELLDIIVNLYYNEKESSTFIIQKIFYDLFYAQINFSQLNNDINIDQNNINEIKGFISEWHNNIKFKNDLSNSIIRTQELFMANDFYSTFNQNKNY